MTDDNGGHVSYRTGSGDPEHSADEYEIPERNVIRMERLDIADGFSIHDYRTKMKLLNDSGDTRTLDNRTGLQCPACEREFDRLFVSDRPTASFETAPERPFCLARTDEKLLLLTH